LPKTRVEVLNIWDQISDWYDYVEPVVVDIDKHLKPAVQDEGTDTLQALYDFLASRLALESLFIPVETLANATQREIYSAVAVALIRTIIGPRVPTHLIYLAVEMAYTAYQLARDAMSGDKKEEPATAG
jgi:hypothetical protein